MDIRKLKPEPETTLPSLGKAKLGALIEEAVVDAYGEDEQKVGLLIMMQVEGERSLYVDLRAVPLDYVGSSKNDVVIPLEAAVRIRVLRRDLDHCFPS